MNIVALTKTFDGEEWIECMIKSIYNYVDKFVFVNSDIAWTGRRGNLCKQKILEIKHLFDYDNKIISIDYNTINQLEQCMAGYNYIKENIKCDYVMLIDTDEVWDKNNIEKALDFLHKNPNYTAYRSGLYTYIKHKTYRITPIEPLEPVVFVRSDLENLGQEARACDLPFVCISGVYYHHYVYVRDFFNKVLEKIITSHVSENKYYMDMSVWIPEVWNKLPHIDKKWISGFHPAIGFHHNWKNIEIINKKDLPEVLR